MNTISLHLEIDPANVKVAEALSNLILVMGGASASVTSTVKKTVKETFKAPVDGKLGIVETSETPETPETPETITTGVTIQELREELGKKVSEHREAIKTKLTSCDGAQNVGKLDPKFYQEFFDFLLTL